MGVPKYFRYLTDLYPKTIQSIQDSDINPDTLFFDLNCLLHPMCRVVITEMNKQQQTCSQDVLEDKMLDKIIENIRKLIALVNPGELVYFSIDGSAPRAKMIQQRYRRFRSVLLKDTMKQIHTKYSSKPSVVWDTNAITPGTLFLEKVSKRIRIYIQDELRHQVKTVVFSSQRVPGEGEQKIMDYMRTHYQNQSLTHCIYGLDADLIMLSLCSGISNIVLLREAVHFGKIDVDQFLYLDIQLLSETLQTKLLNLQTTLQSFQEQCLTLQETVTQQLSIYTESEQTEIQALLAKQYQQQQLLESGFQIQSSKSSKQSTYSKEINLVYPTYSKLRTLQQSQTTLKQQQKTLQDHDTILFRTMIDYLHYYGYLSSNHIDTLTKEQMTIKGYMLLATGETNGILMTEIITNELSILETLTPIELACVFSLFLDCHSEPISSLPHDACLTICKSSKIKELSKRIFEMMIAIENEEYEQQFGFVSDWNVSLVMPEITYQWYGCESFQEIQETLELHDIFVGNFLKSMIQLDNMIREIMNLCGIVQNFTLVTTLEQIHEHIYKDIVSLESLYLV